MKLENSNLLISKSTRILVIKKSVIWQKANIRTNTIEFLGTLILESIETKPYNYIQWNFDKGLKMITMGKMVFSVNDAGTTGHLHEKE